MIFILLCLKGTELSALKLSFWNPVHFIGYCFSHLISLLLIQFHDIAFQLTSHFI